MKKKGQEGEEEDKRAWWQPALSTFARMSGWIFFPILAGIFLGQWLDERFGTAPWLFLLTLAFAFFVSISGIIKISLQEFKKIEEEERKKKEKEDQ